MVVTSASGSVTSSVASLTVVLDPKLLATAEYFWDTDPGVGNGTPVSVPAGQSFTLGAPGSSVLNVNTASLAAGLHKLGFRVVDASSRWSDINWLPVQVQNAATLSASVNNSSIGDANKMLVAAEYFWDSDPGNGNGTPVSVPADESFTLGVPGTNLFNAECRFACGGSPSVGFPGRRCQLELEHHQLAAGAGAECGNSFGERGGFV